MTDSRSNREEGEEPEGLTAVLGSLLNTFHKGMLEDLKPYDVGPVEFTLLSFCRDQGECTATQLARVLPVEASRISRMVSRLVDKGLLRRRRLRNDRRIVMLRLSEPGVELMTELSRRIDAFNVELAQGVSDEEMRIFASVASRIVGNYGTRETR
ncbi:MAG: MarR family transcriptional regulator [Chloroflexi bacterium]|nr:MarR family transcriptional regulator [Chloroflexota bacterium]